MTRPQFSLRTLFWLTLIVAVGFWIGTSAFFAYQKWKATNEATRYLYLLQVRRGPDDPAIGEMLRKSLEKDSEDQSTSQGSDN